MPVPALQQYLQGQGSVSADNFNTFEQTCDTFADLMFFTGVSGMQVFVRGQNTIGDSGQGFYYWNASAAPPGDGFQLIIPAGSVQGGWQRLPPINPISASGISEATVPPTNSSLPVMGGMALTLTPVNTGRLVVMMSGWIWNDSTGAALFQLRYGQGSPPGAGEPVTGNPFGGPLLTRSETGVLVQVPMTLIGFVAPPNIMLNTQYWFDITLQADFGGNTNIANSYLQVIEV